jgi:endonuclease YncB( thermonuclease family)
MKWMSSWFLFVALASFVFVAPDVRAASLFGKVIEVNDGDLITVFNLNRPVKVKLLAVDAPESNQLFGEVAKEHLRQLVLDKSVLVEYTGLGEHSSLVGKVLLRGVDVGAQMIRDGAAWFDPNNKRQLSDADCEVYRLSEEAARTEKRGLWNSENPIPPWEFVRSEKSQSEAVASLVGATERPKSNQQTTSLTNESLLSSFPGASPVKGDTNSSLSSSHVRKTWQKFQPVGENFSVLVPTDGRQIKDAIPLSDGMADVNYYMARDGDSVYSVMWATGPSNGEADLPAIYATLKGFLRGVTAGYQNVGRKFSCEPSTESDISASGFQGREFNMSGCTIPAMARVFTRAVGNQRQMYLGAVFANESDPHTAQFLRSFTVTNPGSVKATTQEKNRVVGNP